MTLSWEVNFPNLRAFVHRNAMFLQSAAVIWHAHNSIMRVFSNMHKGENCFVLELFSAEVGNRNQFAILDNISLCHAILLKC